MSSTMLLVLVFIFYVATTKSTSFVEGNAQPDPNQSILDVLEKLLHRMDNLEEKITFSANAAQRLENTVLTNSKMLQQLNVKNEESKKMRADIKMEIESNTNEIKKLKSNFMRKNDLRKISETVAEIKNVLTKEPPGKISSSPAASCSHINQHYFNLRSGHYWVNIQGKASYEYCRIDAAGVPPEPRRIIEVEILSIDHSSGLIGEYFNFMRQSIPGLEVEGTLFFKATNPRTGASGEVVVWGSPNGGSIGDAHGRFNMNPTIPTPGQWVRGDVLVIQKTIEVEILSVDHSSGVIGEYFNFMRQSIPGLRVKGTLFFKATNPRTGKSGEVVVWGSPNGGSIGDAHGRFNAHVNPAPGQWVRGDVLVIHM